jgi:hypothetical protein
MASKRRGSGVSQMGCTASAGAGGMQRVLRLFRSSLAAMLAFFLRRLGFIC